MAGADEETIRCTVVYAGCVQGVGFRYRTERIAAGLAVGGYVRNLPDGRVEMVAEGVRSELDQLLAGVRATLGGHIRDHQVVEGLATGEFGGFGVRF